MSERDCRLTTVAGRLPSNAIGRHISKPARQPSANCYPIRPVNLLQPGDSFVLVMRKPTAPARTNPSGKSQFLRQSQIPQHIEYVLRGTLDVPRPMRNAEPTPQRRAQRTHDNAPVG